MSLQREILSPVTTNLENSLIRASRSALPCLTSTGCAKPHCKPNSLNSGTHPLPCLNETGKEIPVEYNMKKDSLDRIYDPIKRGKAISITKKKKFLENPEKYREIYRRNGFNGLVKQRFNSLVKQNVPTTKKGLETKKLWKKEEYRNSHLQTRDYSVQIANLEKYRKEHPEMAKIAAVKGAMAVRRIKTSIQIILEEAFKEQNITNFKSEYPIYEAYCIPDIVFLEEKIAIFCDGEKWHNYPYGREKDKEQTNRLIKLGWKVFRFWGNDIKRDPKYCISIVNL